ncbi:GDPmannose 4,6-dehydratase [Filimonas lacunae]|uniref:GDP-mannose 4,6-dehydratase n=1 Tax=Filimonas lacunae TaxID=477680 RepID=A0A173MS10_9BACT|nr:GDP-mannose 4,6-dehydratase [Filimonas lacunae]BAV10219.1 GDP-mannose 4,6-dehydratase [Filimonas lacunae]SIT18126.1 GDPmannose 4,6-dehydratase [Filimonas lacunae]
MKKALICGISGQDGGYIAKFLLQKGFEVYGGSRDAQMASFKNLDILGIKNQIQLISININDFRSTLQTIIKVKPDEIYNLAGQSSVGLSFEQPVETLESITIGTLNILEAIRFSNLPIKFYNAGSSECFGDTGEEAATEKTPFMPRSPYAVAKSTAFWLVNNYRESYQLFACTGILFNHDSPLRPERFVTKKIIAAACRIYKGSTEKLQLGNVEIARDWGWAPEYVEAMSLMLQQPQPDDYIIATGKTHKLVDFIDYTFKYLGMNWAEHVTVDNSLLRPADLKTGRANPQKAYDKLGWKAAFSMENVIENMIAFELERL